MCALGRTKQAYACVAMIAVEYDTGCYYVTAAVPLSLPLITLSMSDAGPYHGCCVCVRVQLEQVLLPGVEGYFGVKANHVPIIAQLKPGVVELHDGTDVTKYFVSGGFAFVHPNSTADICVLEAATLDQFDNTAVKTALQVGCCSGTCVGT